MFPPIMTNQFFAWFFWGWGNLGGWFLFFLIGGIAVIWLIYDSQNRRLPAIGWMMGAVIGFLLILPAILYKFSVNPLDPATFASPLFQFSEPIWYLGMLAGVLPPIIAVGYFFTYRDLVGCPMGHAPYDMALGECPECARARRASQPQVVPQQRPSRRSRREAEPAARVAPRELKPKATAWLTSRDGRTHQLNLGETTLGRSSSNDIQLSGDSTVGRQHAKIIEQNGHFKLVDLGAKNYTRVNGRIVRQPVLLQAGDEIQLGDGTTLQFVTSPR